MHEADEIERLVAQMRGRSMSLGAEPSASRRTGPRPRQDDRLAPGRTSGSSPRGDVGPASRYRGESGLSRSGSTRRQTADVSTSARSPSAHPPVDPRYSARRRPADAPPPTDRPRPRHRDDERPSGAAMAKRRSLDALSEPRGSGPRPAITSTNSSLTRANTVANSGYERVPLPSMDRLASFGDGHIGVTGLRNAGN